MTKTKIYAPSKAEAKLGSVSSWAGMETLSAGLFVIVGEFKHLSMLFSES